MKILFPIPPIRCFTLLALTGLLVLSGSADAAVIFSEDFNDITVTGNNLTTATAGNSLNTTTTTSATSTAIVRDDTSAFFGNGPGDHYVEMVDANTAAGITLRKGAISGIASGGVAQLSFDLYDPVGIVSAPSEDTVTFSLDNTTSGTSSMSVRLLNAEGVSSLVFLNSLGDYVPLTAYNEGAKHSVAIVINYAASAINYGQSLGQSLGGKTFDVWFDGSLVGNDLPFVANTVVTANRITISTSSAATMAMNLDNIVLDNVISVPEPNSFLLAGMGLAGLLFHRKRHQ